MSVRLGVPPMKSQGRRVKIVLWQEGGGWLGYLHDYPDYWTQGATVRDLKEHLKDLYRDIQSGEIPSIRKLEELLIS